MSEDFIVRSMAMAGCDGHHRGRRVATSLGECLRENQPPWFYKACKGAR